MRRPSLRAIRFALSATNAPACSRIETTTAPLPARNERWYRIGDSSMRAGGSDAHPCENTARANEMGSPPAPRNGAEQTRYVEALRDVTNVDRDAGRFGAHEHAIDRVEFFFYRRDLARAHVKARCVRPQDTARALERAVQAFGRRFQHRPVEIALRGDDAPTATRNARYFALVFEGVRNRRQNVDGFLILQLER